MEGYRCHTHHNLTLGVVGIVPPRRGCGAASVFRFSLTRFRPTPPLPGDTAVVFLDVFPAFYG